MQTDDMKEHFFPFAFKDAFLMLTVDFFLCCQGLSLSTTDKGNRHTNKSGENERKIEKRKDGRWKRWKETR